MWGSLHVCIFLHSSKMGMNCIFVKSECLINFNIFDLPKLKIWQIEWDGGVYALGFTCGVATSPFSLRKCVSLANKKKNKFIFSNLEV